MVFFSVLMGLLTLGFLSFTQYFRKKKKQIKKKVYEVYLAVS